MQSSLMVNNMYAAYTATSSYSDKNISGLSKMMKAQNVSGEKEAEMDAEYSMDKVIISKEALRLLEETRLQ